MDTRLGEKRKQRISFHISIALQSHFGLISHFAQFRTHTKANKNGIENKLSTCNAYSIWIYDWKHHGLNEIRENGTREEVPFETRRFVASCIDCNSNFYWKYTLRPSSSPIEIATMLNICVVRTRTKRVERACIIHFSMSKNCCHHWITSFVSKVAMKLHWARFLKGFLFCTWKSISNTFRCLTLVNMVVFQYPLSYANGIQFDSIKCIDNPIIYSQQSIRCDVMQCNAMRCEYATPTVSQ